MIMAFFVRSQWCSLVPTPRAPRERVGSGDETTNGGGSHKIYIGTVIIF